MCGGVCEKETERMRDNALQHINLSHCLFLLQRLLRTRDIAKRRLFIRLQPSLPIFVQPALHIYERLVNIKYCMHIVKRRLFIRHELQIPRMYTRLDIKYIYLFTGRNLQILRPTHMYIKIDV